MMVKNIKSNKIRSIRAFKSLCLLVLLLMVLPVFGIVSINLIQCEDTVSFFANVKPNTTQKVFTLVIGRKQILTDDLIKLLSPVGDKLLIVTSITAYHLTANYNMSFTRIELLAISDSQSTRSWGAGSLSISGGITTHITYRPGLVVELAKNESLGIKNYSNTMDISRVEVHGFLVDRPCK